MAKNKVLYCFECGEKTVHKFISRQTPGDGLGIARGMLAVFSFGISETAGADWYYQCQKCGNLKKK